MLIARDKKENNIAEYIIYIWQLEDLLRANELDFDKVNENIISKFNQTPEIISEIKQWYTDLIELMKAEKLEKQGHTQFIKNVVNDLYSFHTQLLKSPEETQYRDLYKIAAPDIEEFQKKGNRFYDNEMETVFSALYAILLLNIQKKKVTEGTKNAIANFSKLLSMLAFKYHKDEKGNSEIQE